MEKKHYLVYKTTNLVNGKIYIGKHETHNIDDSYLGSGKLLKRAIAKYGKKNFKREILFECSSVEEMNAKEAELVNEEFLKRDDVYNLKQGGDGGFDFINVNGLWGDTSKGGKAFAKKLHEDPEFKKQISNGIKRMWKEHPEVYANLGQHPNSKKSFLGKHHSEQTKHKMSEIAKLRDPTKNSQYNTVWVSNEELKVSFNIPKSMLFDYIGMGYIKKRIVNWDSYFNKRASKAKKQRQLSEKLRSRIDQVQEIANYYMEYGFVKT